MRGTLSGVALPGVAMSLWIAACQVPPPEIPELDLADVEVAVRSSLEDARREVEAAPDSAAAWGKLGRVADAHGFDTIALESYRNARELDPEDVRWPYFSARLLAIDGSRPGEVAGLLEGVVTSQPSYPAARVRLADARLQLGELDAAERHYRRALELDDRLVQAHLGLGQIAATRGDAGAAIVHLEKAREIDPHSAAVLSGLGRAYRLAGRLDEARQAAEAAAGAGPTSPLADPWLEDVAKLGVSSSILFERALARIQAGDFQRASGELEAVARLRPEDPAVHAELGGAYQALGRAEDAIEAYGRALELKDDWVEARLQLVDLLLLQNRAAQAQPHLQRLQPRRDEYPLIEGYIAFALAQQGRVDEAVRRFGWTAERVSLPPHLHNGWGLALAQLNRFAEAEGHFRKALDGMPDSAQAHLYLGLALEAQGRRDDARTHYRRSMSIEPSPMAAQRLEALE